MARLIPLLILVTLVGCAAAPPPEPFYERQVVDLTHPFDEQTVYWPTGSTFVLERQSLGYTEAGFFYAANSFSAPEHGGTHVDAPIHFFEGRQTVDEIPFERLMGPGVLIDVSEACAADTDYLVNLVDFQRWEERHGTIPEGAIVLLRTGFGQRWPDRERYMGTARRGAEAVPLLHFPGLDPETVPWLTGRGIAAIGLDTPSIDHGPSSGFRAHVLLFEQNIPALENVANLDRLPETGFSVIALPMKIRGGSGGPARIVAILD